MYAIIKNGGKQYKVITNKKIKVEKISANIGSKVILDQVLTICNEKIIKFGMPLIKNAKVFATVTAQNRFDKIKIFKMRRRKHYQRHQGHRQQYTELKILSIDP